MGASCNCKQGDTTYRHCTTEAERVRSGSQNVTAGQCEFCGVASDDVLLGVCADCGRV